MRTLSQIIENANNPQPNQFVILKPGFTEYKDEFLNVLKTNGWKVLSSKEKQLTKDEAAELYKDKKDESFYNALCEYMSSGKCLCCSCHKKCDDPIQEMRSLKKKVREQWGEDDMRNAMHCSDSHDNVIRECGLCGINESVADFINAIPAVTPNEPADIGVDPSIEPISMPQPQDSFTTADKGVIQGLKKAFCEEMNAWYQYTICCCFLVGDSLEDVKKFYEDAAKDELDDHGHQILERLHQLGANPDELLTPNAWDVLADHKYIRPVYDTKTSVQLNIDAELGAIETYKKLYTTAQLNNDIVTADMVKNILKDEEEHLRDLKDLQNQMV